MALTMTDDNFRNYSLENLIKDVGSGKTRVPDFQRNWVWKKNDVRDLLLSILKGYPIGVLTILKRGRDNTDFASIPMANVERHTTDADSNEVNLVLDGQQRVTAIYQTLCCRSAEVDPNAIDNNGNPISDATYVKAQNGKTAKLYYYLDMEEFVKDEFDDEKVIVIADREKKVRDKAGNGARILNLKSDNGENEFKNECENKMYPLWVFFDKDKHDEWVKEFFVIYDISDGYSFYSKFYDKLKALRDYRIPYIVIPAEYDNETICKIFEKVNMTGVSLNVFDLLTASFARQHLDGADTAYRLRDKWGEVKNAFKHNNHSGILDGVTPDRFLMAVTLYVTKSAENIATSCKKNDVLKLECAQFDSCYLAVRDGYIKAADFLESECGIHSYEMIPYVAQLAPMAAIFATLNDREINNGINRAKISKWFWRVIFGEQYARSTDSNAARDYDQIIEWIRNDDHPVPDSVERASFNVESVKNIKKGSSAPSKGIFALLIKRGIKDFYSNAQIENVSFSGGEIEIHHVFPKAYCRDTGRNASEYNSIVNLTPISKTTNRDITNTKPSEYLDIMICQKIGSKHEACELLDKHLVNIEALGNNDFESFYEDRKNRIIDMIKGAIGEDAGENVICDIVIEENDDLEDTDYVEGEADDE